MPNSHKPDSPPSAAPIKHPCSGWLLEECAHGNQQWRPLFCHSWKCPQCAKDNLHRVIARNHTAWQEAAYMNMTMKLVTLTFARDVDLPVLYRSLQHLAQDIRRHFALFEYARFPERTKNGRLHLHLVVLAPFIPQETLSNMWRVASGGSYIVDIRSVHNARHLVNYATKYLTKNPATKITYSRKFPGHLTDHIPQQCPICQATHAYIRMAGAPLSISAEYTSLGQTPIQRYIHGPCQCWQERDKSPPHRKDTLNE